MVKCTKGQVRLLKKALYWKGDPKRRERIRMVLLRESGMTQPAIQQAMDRGLTAVNRAHMSYDGGGLKGFQSKRCGGRERDYMTLAEEKALLAGFAKAAGAGEMLNIHDIKAAYEKAIGHETSNSTVYNLLDRHDWRKLMPRPFHPQRDLARLKTLLKNPFSRCCEESPGGLPPGVVVACGSCSPMKRASAG